MIGELGKAARGNPLPPFPFGMQVGGRARRMANENLPDDVSTAEALLRHAGEMFERVALELGQATGRVAQGEIGATKEAVQAARELRDAFRTVMSERERVDKLRSQITGVVGTGAGGPFDFDAARDEISLRLARLRDA